MVDSLEIRLGEQRVGELTGLGGDRTVFVFDDAYADDPGRPTLSLSLQTASREILRDQKPTRVRLSPFFANLLPEGSLRTYLAERAGVKPLREFPLLAALGDDLPGAVTAQPPAGEAFTGDEEGGDGPIATPAGRRLRFSLAGVQLKFSALAKANGGLTIPATGAGGDWIVKLPSTRYAGVAENEYAMMTLARAVGIDVPEIQLLKLTDIDDLPEGVGRLEGDAYAIRRFDRPQGGGRVHMEDFAQVFGVYPEDKYSRASYRLVAEVIWRETGEAGLVEFIRRLVFSALIGNADMHLKNWSLLYADGVTPTLAPAYDFVATTAYLPDDNAALKVARSKAWADFSRDELSALAGKAGLPETLVLATAADTATAFREVWARERRHLLLPDFVPEAIDRQLEIVPLAN
jgi:serine/threonine-protein kinase HipA